MKRFKISIILTIVIPIAVAIFWLASTSRAATETPDYKIIRTDGKVEIRDYPVLSLATTPMEGGEMNAGFGQLFRYITGSNEKSQKIEMTSPVLIDTAKDRKTMSFIMPKTSAEKGLPKPVGDRVTLGEMDAARFAVLRFNGGRSADNETKAIKALKEWLNVQKIAGSGDVKFAYYDPPWTPVFMRRNEVMIRIGKQRD